MSKAHIEKLRNELENTEWHIISDENIDYWLFARPNKEITYKLNFTIWGNGNFGAKTGNETIENAISCHVDSKPDLDLYFGKFSKKFQKDVALFVSTLNKTLK